MISGSQVQLESGQGKSVLHLWVIVPWWTLLWLRAIIARQDHWLLPSFGSWPDTFWYHENQSSGIQVRSSSDLWTLQSEGRGFFNNRDLPSTSEGWGGGLRAIAIVYNVLGIPWTTLIQQSHAWHFFFGQMAFRGATLSTQMGKPQVIHLQHNSCA